MLALVAVGSGRATTIVIVYSAESNVIIIGADSRRGNSNGTFTKNVCKVNQSNGIFFTFDGLTKLAWDQSEGRDVVNRAFSTSKGGVLNKINGAEQALKPWLQRQVNVSRTSDPGLFKRWTSGEDYPTAITFSGFDNGRLIVHFVIYLVAPTGAVMSQSKDLASRDASSGSIGYSPRDITMLSRTKRFVSGTASSVQSKRSEQRSRTKSRLPPWSPACQFRS